MRKLTSVRLRVVAQKLREARCVLSEEMRDLSVNCFKSEVGQAWQDVRRIQKETWDAENPKHQQKFEHLTRRAEQCQNHRSCREVERLVMERLRRSTKIDDRQVAGILADDEDTQVKTKVEPRDPCSLLSQRYFSYSEDLGCLGKEESQMKRITQAFNHRWKASQEVDVDDNEEVMVFWEG